MILMLCITSIFGIQNANAQNGFCIAGLATELEDSGSSDVLNLNLFDASFVLSIDSINGEFITEWEWTLNGAFLSDEQNPTTVVTIGGEYEVCLTINTNLGCTSSVCEVINFNADDCENVVGFLIEAAGFEVSVNGNTANFEQWTTEFPGSENVVYNWDFGDGNTSTETNPTHEYAESGAFIVCSEATDIELNCSAEWCDSLFVGSGSTNYELCGNILIETDSNAMTDFDATVYLIEYDAAPNTYETVAETIVYGSVFGADSSFAWFCFGDLPEGSEYIVKAAINPTNILFDGFVPTYYGDVIFWNEATVITMTENEYIDINMVSILDGFEGLATNDDVGELGIAVSNEGTVNGYVMNGVAEGMPNIQVMLLTLDNQPVSYTYTNADGFYELSAIDNGEYIVYVEMIGIICIPSDVSITTENNELSINFELEGNQVSAGSVGIFDNTIASSFALDIYPNPVHNQAVIAFEVNKSSDASLSVINMLGQTVLQENINLQQGKNTLNLNVSELKSACYFLQIQDSEGKIYMTQFVK